MKYPRTVLDEPIGKFSRRLPSCHLEPFPVKLCTFGSTLISQSFAEVFHAFPLCLSRIGDTRIPSSKPRNGLLAHSCRHEKPPNIDVNTMRLKGEGFSIVISCLPSCFVAGEKVFGNVPTHNRIRWTKNIPMLVVPNVKTAIGNFLQSRN